MVTSRESAALQDMLRVFKERAPIVELVIVHTPVQGESAASSIAGAIQKVDQSLANMKCPVDLIIMGRGGGSRRICGRSTKRKWFGRSPDAGRRSFQR